MAFTKRTVQTVTFKSLGVDSWLQKQVEQMGISTPTPVQEHTIPPILEGKDVIGCAKTGTGKTLAFALPIIQQLARDPFGIYALVLTPTRELALQIAEQFVVLGKPMGLNVCVVIGGRDMVQQAQQLGRKPHIVIATPGRLADQIDTAGTDHMCRLFKKLHFFVLDEADRLLDGQYAPQLKSILSALPKNRQSLLFSATITDALNKLQEVSMKKPVFFEDTSETATVDQLDQRYVLCPVDFKDAYLVYVVKNFVEKHPDSSVLIFCQTCRECQALTEMFKQLNFRVGAIHSMIPQAERTTSLSKFRDNRVRILLSTDVAARGLDIPTVNLVVNHNVPAVPKNYIHRVGRSARAGRFGNAITFVTQYDIALLKDIEHQIGHEILSLKVSDKKVAQHVTEVLVAKREAEIKLDKQNFGEKREINRKKQMILEGIDPDQVEEAIRKRREARKADSNKRVTQLNKRTVNIDKKIVRKKQKLNEIV